MKLVAWSSDSRSKNLLIDRFKTVFPNWARIFDNVYIGKETGGYIKAKTVRERLLRDLHDEGLLVIDVNRVDDDPIWASMNIPKEVTDFLKK